MVHVVLPVAGVVDHRGAVSGGFDGMDQIVLRHLWPVFDVRALDGEVHRGLHALQVIEAAFDPGRAGRAAHAAQLKVGRRHSSMIPPRGILSSA